MKNAWFVLLAVVVMSGAIGCAHHKTGCPPGGRHLGGMHAPHPCSSCRAKAAAGVCHGCGVHGCRGGCGLRTDAQAFAAGPATGAVTYPYYTVRGPRDFLVPNPQPIGP